MTQNTSDKSDMRVGEIHQSRRIEWMVVVFTHSDVGMHKYLSSALM